MWARESEMKRIMGLVLVVVAAATLAACAPRPLPVIHVVSTTGKAPEKAPAQAQHASKPAPAGKGATSVVDGKKIWSNDNPAAVALARAMVARGAVCVYRRALADYVVEGTRTPGGAQSDADVVVTDHQGKKVFSTWYLKWRVELSDWAFREEEALEDAVNPRRDRAKP